MRRATVATALLVLVVLAAGSTTAWEPHPPQMPALLPSSPADMPSMPPQPPPGAGEAPLEGEQNETAGTIFAVVLAILLLAFLAWIGTVLGRHLRMRYAPDAADSEEAPAAAAAVVADPAALEAAVQDAAQRALAHVDRAGGIPEDSVIAAWVALTDAAATHGARRHPSDTPTEFTTTILATTRAPATDVATLRRLYQRARFTSHPITDDDVRAARAALAGVARALDPVETS